MEEIKNVAAVKEMQEDTYKSGSVQYIDSREVAEIVEKKHKNLLADITRYSKELNQLNFQPIEFFIESDYKDSVGRTQKCYLVTKKGCEFIAHKLTGIKGTKFTATYINRFHEMQDELTGGRNEIFVEIGDKLVKLMGSQQEFIEQQLTVNKMQAEFNKTVTEFMSETMQRQGKTSAISSVNPFGFNENVVKKRMETLNDLIDEVAELCNLDRNKVLHYMYQRIQESENVNLKSYLNVFRTEMKDNEICTFHVVCSIDHLFEKAAEMNKDVIERKRIYG